LLISWIRVSVTRGVTGRDHLHRQFGEEVTDGGDQSFGRKRGGGVAHRRCRDGKKIESDRSLSGGRKEWREVGTRPYRGGARVGLRGPSLARTAGGRRWRRRLCGEGAGARQGNRAL
jgi:hypothetical protein